MWNKIRSLFRAPEQTSGSKEHSYSTTTDGYTIKVTLLSGDIGTQLEIQPKVSPAPEASSEQLVVVTDSIRELIVEYGAQTPRANTAHQLGEQIKERIHTGVQNGVLMDGASASKHNRV